MKTLKLEIGTRIKWITDNVKFNKQKSAMTALILDDERKFVEEVYTLFKEL